MVGKLKKFLLLIFVTILLVLPSSSFKKDVYGVKVDDGSNPKFAVSRSGGSADLFNVTHGGVVGVGGFLEVEHNVTVGGGKVSVGSGSIVHNGTHLILEG